MKKIAIIEEIDKEGLKLFDKNPNFSYKIFLDYLIVYQVQK